MNWQRTPATAGLVAWFVFAAALHAQTLGTEARGEIRAVTVYRGQALVTRELEVELPAGDSAVFVTDLPAAVAPESLYAEGDGPAVVRAVRFEPAERRVGQGESDELEATIKQAQAALRATVAAQHALEQKQSLLAALEGFTTARINAESEKLLPAPESVKGIAEVLFAQHDALLGENLKLRSERETLEAKLEDLRQKKQQAPRVEPASAGRAVVYVQSPQGGRGRLRVRYLVNGADWSPSYNLRAGASADAVSLEILAVIDQHSGEDWKQVRLTLSTASPAMAAEAPTLTPLWLEAAPRSQAGSAGGDEVRETALGNLAGALQQRGQDSRSLGLHGDLAANEWAARLQIMDLAADPRPAKGGAGQPRMEAPLAVTYELPGTVSVASDERQQLVQVAIARLPAEPYYVAEPVLTSYVYRHVEITNTSGMALLRGPVKCFVDDQFVGVGALAVAATDQRFTLGLGVEPRLRAFRELVSKEDRVQGSNRKMDFRYRLVLENYGPEAATLRLLERIPAGMDDKITVSLGKLTQPLSVDPVYQRTLRGEGVLRWDVKVPGGAAAAKAKTLEYEFRMELDKDLSPTQPTGARVEEKMRDFARTVQNQ
jgi:uncharacterized protein (TIGR02231 family)